MLTSFALLYVWQQTEIFRLAYVGQKNAAFADELIDSNAQLRYNIDRNTSLVSIGSKLPGEKTFQMPDTYRLVKVAPRESGRSARNIVRRPSIAYRLFGIKREAQAKTVSP